MNLQYRGKIEWYSKTEPFGHVYRKLLKVDGKIFYFLRKFKKDVINELKWIKKGMRIVMEFNPKVWEDDSGNINEFNIIHKIYLDISREKISEIKKDILKTIDRENLILGIFPETRHNYNLLVAYYWKYIDDVDLSKEVIEHIGESSPAETITRARRVLKSGGVYWNDYDKIRAKEREIKFREALKGL